MTKKKVNNKIVRPKGLGRDQKPKKGPKPSRKAGIPNLKGKVKPAPMVMKGKTVYQPK